MPKGRAGRAQGTAPKEVRPKRPKRVAADVARLSRSIEGLLVDAQRKAKPPKGMVKCPACGLALQPTKNKRVRTHDDPIAGRRCEASARPWPASG